MYPSCKKCSLDNYLEEDTFLLQMYNISVWHVYAVLNRAHLIYSMHLQISIILSSYTGVVLSPAFALAHC